MKKYGTLFLLVVLTQWCFAQTDTLKGEAAKELLRKINIDTTRFLVSASDDACKCIDSIDVANKSGSEITEAIAACIDKRVESYELAMKMYHSMIDPGKNIDIIINVNKNSDTYKRYYYDIERMLNDSCASLRTKSRSDNKESEYSFSKNKKSVGFYNKAIASFNNENYKDALPLFEKAVEVDDKFSFAWDNIGICRRKLGDLDGALVAYNKSLELDPRGVTPLHNIPVVYEYKKDYDKALEAYQNLSKVYPDDPEAYYGGGRMYELKGDIEKATDYMCKAYNAYVKVKSPFRTDAENNLSIYYRKMKELGKEDKFYAILKDNNISTK